VREGRIMQGHAAAQEEEREEGREESSLTCSTALANALPPSTLPTSWILNVLFKAFPRSWAASFKLGVEATARREAGEREGRA